jgi:hypothetical protein
VRGGFDCEVTAGFLESGRTLANVANAAAIIAGIGCWTSRGVTEVLLALSLMAWIVGSWCAVRVSIDRSLFRTLAKNPTEGGDWLDALLVDWNLVKGAPSRSMHDRSRGALRLWRRQSTALAVQLAALAAALLVRL